MVRHLIAFRLSHVVCRQELELVELLDVSGVVVAGREQPAGDLIPSRPPRSTA
jgi:hypothetical protein